MKRYILLSFAFITSCALIYANSSFIYKTNKDWSMMTLENVQTIIKNGGNVKERNADGYTPLTLICRYNVHVEIVKFLIENGANPKECHLDEYIKNISRKKNFNIVFKGTSLLLSLGVAPTSFAEDKMLSIYSDNQKEILKLFEKYKTYPSKEFVRNMILINPLEYKDILKKYNVSIPAEEVVLWRLKSKAMQEKRNKKEWYKLVDEAKKLGVKEGYLGMSKAEYIAEFGIPDREYKLNADTIILVYIQEERRNIPVSSQTIYSSSGSADYNQYLNTVQSSSFGVSRTQVKGGYMSVNQWQNSVYIDRGIVTGIKRKDKITTY